MAERDFSEHDQAFEAFRRTHPEARFSEFYTSQVAQKIRHGDPHPTLGPKLKKHADWHEGGKKVFANYLRFFPITRQSRVVDYGCGSLRVGSHFIRHLDAGCYFGLDVIGDFYEMGKALIGDELIGEKRPIFRTIGEATIKDASDFGADFVYSSAVSYHVHPDELGAYLGAMAAIASKPGAILFFDAAITDNPKRYRHRSWSHSLDHLVSGLAPLAFAGVRRALPTVRDDHSFSLALLEFRRQ